jgi:hypothetical protein
MHTRACKFEGMMTSELNGSHVLSAVENALFSVHIATHTKPNFTGIFSRNKLIFIFMNSFYEKMIFGS